LHTYCIDRAQNCATNIAYIINNLYANGFGDNPIQISERITDPNDAPTARRADLRSRKLICPRLSLVQWYCRCDNPSRQYVEQQKVAAWRQSWVYQTDRANQQTCINFVPGLGAALKHGDWAAAYSLWAAQYAREAAYEKAYGRPSPAYEAAARKAGGVLVKSH
jgi:hypothetical protein